MIPDFPLGINEVLRALEDEDAPSWPALPEHWYWCRRHQEAEHVNTPTKRDDDPTISCIRIGPFMSEREANRLGGSHPEGVCECDKALGLEVEK